MAHRSPLDALNIVLASVDAVRNLRAVNVLLMTFSIAGLLMAMAEASLAKNMVQVGAIEAGAALFAAFYGGNAAGILVMDDARGGPVRDISDALRTSLLTAHRLLLALALLSGAYVVFAALLYDLLWLCRVSITGPVVGPLLFGAVVPVGVVGVGVALLVSRQATNAGCSLALEAHCGVAPPRHSDGYDSSARLALRSDSGAINRHLWPDATLALVVVVVPLAAPAVWTGSGVIAIVWQLLQWIRQRLITIALLMAAVSLLTGAVGALVTFAVMAGGRAVSLLGVAVVGVDVPAQQLMAGLFGYGLRSLGAAGAPTGSTGHAAAALVGGGVVFALALVLPGLVYLRGTCSVYLAMRSSTN